jgi:hypothetical protein
MKRPPVRPNEFFRSSWGPELTARRAEMRDG